MRRFKTARPPAERIAAVGVVVALLVGCAPTGRASPTPPPGPGATGGSPGGRPPSQGVGPTSPFFDARRFEEEERLGGLQPVGPDGEPWAQAIDPDPVDTSAHRREPPWRVCLSSGGRLDAWWIVGQITAAAEAERHPGFGSFEVADAAGAPDRQVQDIGRLASAGCDALIVAALPDPSVTAAVRSACVALPVVLLAGPSDTDCPVTSIRSVGPFAFGASGARFLADALGPSGSVLVVRSAATDQVLGERWAGAQAVFSYRGVDVLGVVSTGGDPAKASAAVADHIDLYGRVDGVWVDSGSLAVAAAAGFASRGRAVGAIAGEDQQDFLELWSEERFPAVAPTDPAFQWRTAVVAVGRVLSGEAVPDPWIVPQPTVTEETLDHYLVPGMPPLHRAACGCRDLPGFPQRWGGGR